MANILKVIEIMFWVIVAAIVIALVLFPNQIGAKVVGG